MLEQDRRASQGEISDLRSELNRESQRRDRALQEIRESQDRIEAARARDREALADVRQGGQRLWLINEAESLAALAGQRLMLTGDAEAARRLEQHGERHRGAVDEDADEVVSELEDCGGGEADEGVVDDDEEGEELAENSLVPLFLTTHLLPLGLSLLLGWFLTRTVERPLARRLLRE